jgi:rhodanese-related sulfurtransferase
MTIIDKTLLDHLEPVAKLSASRKQELADLCFIEQVDKDIDPLRMNVTKASQLVYLLKGDLGLRYNNDDQVILRGGSPAARHPLNNGHKVKDTVALTDIEILRIDTDLLDIMMTWDQLSSVGLHQPPAKSADVKSLHGRKPKDWMRETRAFSASNLQNGVFSRLPAANIEQMFKRMTMIDVTAGQVIIQQGAEGDYYYLIERGSVVVSKIVDVNEPAVILAELDEGDAFGEEALASDNKRNATVTMKTDGELLRLNKKDFVELLKEPLITQVSRMEAEAKVAAGAIWADVRLPSEYNFDHMQGAINLPLNEIRQLANELDPTKTYVLYCQTGRRSSAAAFILVQRGFDVVVLAGGTRAR